MLETSYNQHQDFYNGLGMGSVTNVLEISSDEEGEGEEMNSERGKSLERLLDSSRASDTALDDDDCEVAIIEKPPDFIQPARKRGKIVHGISSLNDECCILDCNPEKTVSVSETIGNDSEDLAVTAERGHVACRDYPHSRHCCVSYPYNSTPHEKHCALCHCYVCDKPAPCLLWGQGNLTSDHCHASDKEDKWRKLRKSYNLKKTKMILPPTVDAVPLLSSGRSTVRVTISNQEGADTVTNIPSNICQNAASQLRPSSLTDPASSRGPFSSAALSCHLTDQRRAILASSMSSIDSAGISNRIGRKEVLSTLSISGHGGVHHFRPCSSTEHLNTDFQIAITGHSAGMHASSRRSCFSTRNQNPAPKTGPASMYSLCSCMPGQLTRIRQSASIQTNSMSSTVQSGRYNPVGRRKIASASLNINHGAAFQSGCYSSTNNLNGTFETGPPSTFDLHGYLPSHNANIGQSGSMYGISTSSPGQTGRRSLMCLEPVTSVLSDTGHVSGHQFMPCSSENNLNPSFQLGMVPAFGLQAHFPGQIGKIGQSGTRLASSMNSTGQAGSSQQVGSIASVPTDISQVYAQQINPSPSTNNLNPAFSTNPLSALDLSCHLLLPNAMIDQGQSMFANSMMSTCQVGSSDHISIGTVACNPLNISYSCADQFRPSSFKNNLNPPPQTQPTNQFRSSSFTNNLNSNPPSQIQPPFTFDLSPHLYGQTEIRIASSTSSMDQVGTSCDASTDAAAAVSLYNGCSSMHPVGSIQDDSCSSMINLHCASYTNLVSSLSMATHLPGQIGSMHVGSTLRDTPHLYINGPSIMATEFQERKISSLERNSMETTEPLKMMLSSNDAQTTLENWSATQKVYQSADEGDSIDVLSRNATSVQNAMHGEKLSWLLEFLLDDDSDDDF